MTVVPFPVARPYLQDADIVCRMESALRNWSFNPQHRAERMVIYREIGVTKENAERLDEQAVRMLDIHHRVMMTGGE